jgi:hypothetical protein
MGEKKTENMVGNALLASRLLSVVLMWVVFESRMSPLVQQLARKRPLWGLNVNKRIRTRRLWIAFFRERAVVNYSEKRRSSEKHEGSAGRKK